MCGEGDDSDIGGKQTNSRLSYQLLKMNSLSEAGECAYIEHWQKAYGFTVYSISYLSF